MCKVKLKFPVPSTIIESRLIHSIHELRKIDQPWVRESKALQDKLAGMLATEAMLYLLTIRYPELVEPAERSFTPIFPRPLDYGISSVGLLVGRNLTTGIKIDDRADNLCSLQDHLI